MSQLINKKSVPIGAILLPVCLILDILSTFVRFLVLLFLYRIPLGGAISSSLNFSICMAFIIYAAIVVFAFIKKPQFTVFPFALMIIFAVISVLSALVQTVSGIVDGYLLNLNGVLNCLVDVVSPVLEIVVYGALAFIAVECFGVFKKPVIARFWAIPGVIAIIASVLNPISSIGSLLLSVFEFGTSAKSLIGSLIITVVAAIPAVVYGIAIFLIAMWLGKSVIGLYAKESSDAIAEPEVDEAGDNGI